MIFKLRLARQVVHVHSGFSIHLNGGIVPDTLEKSSEVIHHRKSLNLTNKKER